MDEEQIRFLDIPHDCSVPDRIDPFDVKMNPIKKLLLRLMVISEKHPEHWKYMECKNDILFEKRRQIVSKFWFVLHPFSTLCGLVDTFMLFVYAVDQVNVPFTDTINSRNVYNICVPLVMVNVIRQFITGYMDKESIVVILDFKKILWHYLSGWFIPDFLGAWHVTSTIVWLCKVCHYELSENTRLIMGIMDLSIIFTLRLFVKNAMLTLEYFNANATVKRIVLLALCGTMILHYSTCLTVFIPLCVHGKNLPNVDASWVNIVGEGKQLKPFQQPKIILYFISLFRTTMLLMKLGFGIEYPKTAEDAYFSMALVVMGRLLFFFLLEQVLSLNNWVRSPRVRYHVFLKTVKDFLQQRRVPPNTQRKVQMYFERQLGGTYFRESSLLPLLSVSLREELRAHELRLVIRDSHLLRRLPPALAARVALCLKLEIFLPNDVVMRAGTFGDCMYLLSSGTVSCVHRNGCEIIHFDDGCFFGVVDIVSSLERRLISAIAIEVCEIYRLNREDAIRYLRMDPVTWSFMKQEAHNRMMMVERLETVGQEYVL